MTRVNVVDALASMAVLLMGEANESCPLALIEGADLVFTDRKIAVEDISMLVEEDLYAPFLLRPLGSATGSAT
jgi:dihydrofolate synthase / folylpolyglutamate synthase